MIDASKRQLINEYCKEFNQDVAFDTCGKRLVVADFVRLRIIEAGEEVWASKLIALDGIRNLEVEGRILHGLAVVGFEG